MSRVLQAIDSIHQVGVYCLALVPPNSLPKVGIIELNQNSLYFGVKYFGGKDTKFLLEVKVECLSVVQSLPLSILDEIFSPVVIVSKRFAGNL